MKKKLFYIIIEVVLLVAIVIVGIYNAFSNECFWAFSFSQVITLIIAILIAFAASQYRNDERKLKEQAEKIIVKIQNIVSEISFSSFPNFGDNDEIKKQNRLACRKLNNCISILKEYATKLNILAEVDYIDNQFKEYNDFISQHPDDLDYLSKSEIVLKKYSENIDTKCDHIILKLFK